MFKLLFNGMPGSYDLLYPQSFMVSENEVLQRETLIPVYVVPEDDQLLCMYEEVKQAAASRTSSIFVRGEREDCMNDGGRLVDRRLGN